MKDTGLAYKRSTNIELLRIISMFLIVIHHFAIHGNFDFSTSTVTLNEVWIQFIQLGGKIGVNLFVLISGYFLVKGSSIKVNKLVKLWFEIFLYSVVIYAIFVLTHAQTFVFKEFVKSIMPITFSNWWFVSTYFILYLLSPFLNKFLNNIDKTFYQRLLLLLTLLWCVIPTFTSKKIECNNLTWFIYLYTIAGYIRIYWSETRLSGKTFITAGLVLCILTFLTAIFLDFLGTKVVFFSKHATYFYSNEKIFILFASIFMFIGFLNLNIKYSKLINTFSSATFGVYLIHDHEFVRNFLWNVLFKQSTFSTSKYLIIYSIFAVVSVYVVCTIIDLIRKNTVEKIFTPIINKVSNIISKVTTFCCSNKFLSKW